MADEKVHIPDYPGKERERVAVNRIFTDTASPLSRIQGWSDVSEITLPWAVVGLRIPYHYIDGGEDRGDIDVLFIPLTIEEILRKEDFKPTLRYIEAFEVKVGCLDREGKLRARLSFFNKEEGVRKQGERQKKARKQVLKLCNSGFDKVSIVYLISTKPKENFSRGIVSWLMAGDNAREALRQAEPQIDLEMEDPFGTILFAVGAVPGRTEEQSGTIPSLVVKKPPPPNPFKAQGIRFRKALEGRLQEVFSRGLEKLNPPVLVLACSKCPNIYISKVGPDAYCPDPDCNSKPH